MVRTISLCYSENDETPKKLIRILDGIVIRGYKIEAKNNFSHNCIEISSGNVNAPTIESLDELARDLCHSARSQSIPCTYQSTVKTEKIKLIIPKLPEFDLDGNNPTMCLELEIKFLETIISRLINLNFIDRSSSP